MFKSRDGPFLTSLTIIAVLVAVLLLVPTTLWSDRGGMGRGSGSGGGYRGGGDSGRSMGHVDRSTGGGWHGPQGGVSSQRSVPNQSFGRGPGETRGFDHGNPSIRSGQGWSSGRNYGRSTVQPDNSRINAAPSIPSAGRASTFRSSGGRGGFRSGSTIQPSAPRSSGRFEGRAGGRERFVDRDFHRPRFSAGFFFYDFPGFAGPYYYGYWGFGYFPSAYYSPFFYYGFPYVYGPRVVVIVVPSYGYYDEPSSYWSDYYLSPGYQSGLTEALDDIRNAWVTGRDDLMLRHIDSGTEVAVYQDGKYSYSLPGSDFEGMTRDAIKHVRTVDFTIYKVARRSDGAYTAFARHEFYDVNGVDKTVYVSDTMLQVDDRWIVVAAGSSDRKLR